MFCQKRLTKSVLARLLFSTNSYTSKSCFPSTQNPCNFTILGCCNAEITPTSFKNSTLPCFDFFASCFTAIAVPFSTSPYTPSRSFLHQPCLPHWNCLWQHWVALGRIWWCWNSSFLILQQTEHWRQSSSQFFCKKNSRAANNLLDKSKKIVPRSRRLLDVRRPLYHRIAHPISRRKITAKPTPIPIHMRECEREEVPFLTGEKKV